MLSGAGSLTEWVSTDKLVRRHLGVNRIESLDSATRHCPAYPAHASGSPRDGIEVTQSFVVTASGELLGPGEKDDMINGWGYTEIGSIPLLNEGLGNDVPKNRRPIKGPYVPPPSSNQPAARPTLRPTERVGGSGMRQPGDAIAPGRAGGSPLWN